MFHHTFFDRSFKLTDTLFYDLFDYALTSYSDKLIWMCLVMQKI